MAKFKQHKAGDDGWSEWDSPIMKGYKIACCDCGLVHNMDFQVVRVTKTNPDGTWEHGKPLDSGKYRVLFRVSRNERSTGQMRRKKKIIC